jgi:hypothetical protein
MTAQPSHPLALDPDAPLTAFSQCHAGILARLDALAGLPALIAAAEKARKVSTDALALFQHGVFDHHAEEEGELFCAVVRSAHAGHERDSVQAMVDRLTHEHRSMEALWKRVEPAVHATARGKPAQIDSAAVAELVCAYGNHARFEEQEFLPLAEIILGRNGNHMAALGLSMHMRHAQTPVGYI